jgi:itaconate CoA-transferase
MRPDLAQDERFRTNPLRSEARRELQEVIEACFRTLSSDDLVRRLETANIANARVNELADVWGHPQLTARGRWGSVQSSAGDIPALLPPGTEAQDASMGPIPELGQHTRSILEELGYRESQLTELQAAKVI